MLRNETGVDAVELFDRASLKECERDEDMTRLVPDIMGADPMAAALLIECRGRDEAALQVGLGQGQHVLAVGQPALTLGWRALTLMQPALLLPCTHMRASALVAAVQALTPVAVVSPTMCHAVYTSRLQGAYPAAVLVESQALQFCWQCSSAQVDRCCILHRRPLLR